MTASSDEDSSKSVGGTESSDGARQWNKDDLLPAEAPLLDSCDKNREVDGGRNAELENDGEERS